ncbi:hypothetical protein BJ546DRAFT_1062607 [Cryomyces antarcticus]|uniref:Hydrophobin n=1 Tax=Cryomyces antarcticus TaxID=329879 RepID=A0ABR0LX55_9PEZI|nr:hypothetical protein LTR39_004230 [Cryomyces antarcticus]KAK5013043.1 hypothetical protein LTR60_004070 [Cryomyces antarcticus]KAK5254529.1 hypothetical protein LTR16_004830 [Cryomyces antarcticus]
MAAPSPAPGPPPPPKKGVSSVSQSCSASQSSISCCNVSNGNPSGPPKKGQSVVAYPNGGNVIDCSIIVVDGNKNKLVNQICSTTVACCIGNGCIAIAE